MDDARIEAPNAAQDKPTLGLEDLELREITQADIADPKIENLNSVDVAEKAKRLVTEEATSLRGQLINKEGVHPIRMADDLREHRVPPLEKPKKGVWNKRCFGLFPKDESLPQVPAVVVYVNLQKLPADAKGHVADENLPGNIAQILNEDVESTENPNTAVFYTITNLTYTKAGKRDEAFPYTLARGASPAESLIGRVATKLKEEENIQNFTTLSPLREGVGIGKEGAKGFAQWLDKALTPSIPIESAKPAILTQGEIAQLKKMGQAMAAAGDDGYIELFKGQNAPEGEVFAILRLARECPGLIPSAHKDFFTQLIKDLAVYYIAEVKAVDKKTSNVTIHPQNGVAKFHLSNGARVGKVQFDPGAETTPSDENGGGGITANYRYDLAQLADNKAAYRDGKIMMNEELKARHGERMATLARENPPLNTVYVGAEAARGAGLAGPAGATGRWV